MVFPVVKYWMWELDYKESWVAKNWFFWTVVLEKTLESPLDCKEIQSVHLKGDQSWVFIGRTDAEAETPNTWVTWCKELTHLKRPWCWETLKAGGEGDVRGWDGWMASPIQWTWVWVNSESRWWTGRPGVLRFAGLQSWTRLSWPDLVNSLVCCCSCWVASVVSDPVRPHRQPPTGLLRPQDSLGKNTGVGCHFFLQQFGMHLFRPHNILQLDFIMW